MFQLLFEVIYSIKYIYIQAVTTYIKTFRDKVWLWNHVLLYDKIRNETLQIFFTVNMIPDIENVSL